MDDDARHDRQMIELLNELRVALPGVQILFGFLLTVPFAAGFEDVSDFQRDLYFATLLLTVVSAACLISPSAAHRLLFHRGDRVWLIEHGNRMLIGGLGFLALALVAAVTLVADYLFAPAAAIAFGAGALGLVAILWFALPWRRRRRAPRRSQTGSTPG